MRREHLIETSGTDGNTLIFYAPLTQGDLTDHVSGVTAIYGSDPNGSVTWDSDIDAYRFDKTGYGQACVWGILNLGINYDSTNIVTDKLCLEYDIYFNNLASDFGRRGVCLGCYTSATQNTSCIPLNSIQTLPSNDWHHFKSVCENKTTYTYIDDRLDSTRTNYPTIIKNYGSLIPQYINRYVAIGRIDGSGQKQTYYLKNIKLYIINY